MTQQRSRSKKSAIDRLADLLARRDHSRAEIRSKLGRLEYSSEEVESAIEFAELHHWLPNEQELARREAGRLARAGKSRLQIRGWLKKKGLPIPPPTHTQEELEIEAESALKVATKSWVRILRAAERDKDKGLRLETAVGQRVSRLLMSRGFSGSTARDVLNRLWARHRDENPL